ncbi:hypothetical protein NE237_029609 [Protea cynaroides]|uniref:CBS domain-containing protein CBSCBSPB3-like n=1 Tax=Protea cynaroides TaxID=273540 RepID=A0A9Q0GRI3_9MAGN|nr:hypothetical protein NE237_029609 [Protea cynaroides]
MTGQSALHPRRNNLNPRRGPSSIKKSAPVPENSYSNGTYTKPSSPRQSSVGGGRTVKKLRLSKSLSIPEGTTVSDACRRMASRRVDAALLIDANGLLSGIITDKDIATGVVAEGLKPELTVVSQVMTRNPVFVSSDSLAIEALQMMFQGNFRHLPVVENGEVIAVLDITKLLYDAISRMEKAAEQGSAIAAAVEGVERQWGSCFPASYAFIDTLRERMFKPSLSTIIPGNSKVAVVSPSDLVSVATKKMRDLHVSSVIVTTGNKPLGILTSKDVVMRVVSQNLSPELTHVEKVMTPNPEYATLETTILETLHIMHDGKFLHLPVVDKDGSIAACVDVLQITHAAISLVEGNSGAVNDMTNTTMQKFWDSALVSEPPDDESDTHSEMSALMASECTESSRSLYPPLGLGNSFPFKFHDRKGHVHKFNCGTERLDELVSAVKQRIGTDDVQNHQFLYEDDEGDKVLLTSDSDLTAAVGYAKLAGSKALRLHLDDSESSKEASPSMDTTTIQKIGRLSLGSGLLAGAAALAGTSLLVYLKRSSQ